MAELESPSHEGPEAVLARLRSSRTSRLDPGLLCFHLALGGEGSAAAQRRWPRALVARLRARGLVLRVVQGLGLAIPIGRPLQPEDRHALLDFMLEQGRSGTLFLAPELCAQDLVAGIARLQGLQRLVRLLDRPDLEAAEVDRATRDDPGLAQVDLVALVTSGMAERLDEIALMLPQVAESAFQAWEDALLALGGSPCGQSQ